MRIHCRSNFFSSQSWPARRSSVVTPGPTKKSSTQKKIQIHFKADTPFDDALASRLVQKIKLPRAFDVLMTHTSGETQRLDLEGTWKLLYDSTTRLIRSVMIRFFPKGDAVEDAVTQTWYNVFRYLDSYDPGPLEEPNSFHAWLYRVALNTAAKLKLRDFRYHRKAPVSLDERFSDSLALKHEAVCPNPGPEATLSDREQLQNEMEVLNFRLFVLEVGFENLGKMERELLLGIDVEQVSYREMAQRFHFTVNALKSAIFRARKRVVDFFSRIAEFGSPRPLTESEMARVQAHRDLLLKAYLYSHGHGQRGAA